MKHCKAFAAVALSLAILLLYGAGCQSGKPKTVERPREYSFWPPAPDEPRVQFLVAFNSSEDVVPPQKHMDEVMYGRQQILAIVKPYGVAMWQGKIYVCDVQSKGVTVLDLRQHIVKAVGVGGSIEIAKAVDIALAPDGMKYVVDNGNHAIVVMDQQDHPVEKYAIKDFDPLSVAVYGNELFTIDYKACKVKVLDRATGRYLRGFGEAGDGDGQFTGPLTVRVDPSGVVYVGDVLTSRIQRFTRDGKFLSAFGRPGNLAGDMVRPKHFSFDKQGYLYLADAAFNNVQVFDEQQKVVGYFGAVGNHPGSMELPAGVFVDETPEDVAMFRQYVHPAFEAERLILVTNQFGLHRVSVYAGGRLKPGKTVADVAPARIKVPLGTLEPTTRPTTQPLFIPGSPTTQPAVPAGAAN